MKYKVLHVSAFSSYFSSLNLYFYVSTLSVNRVGLGRLHVLALSSVLGFTLNRDIIVFFYISSFIFLFKDLILIKLDKSDDRIFTALIFLCSSSSLMVSVIVSNRVMNLA